MSAGVGSGTSRVAVDPDEALATTVGGAGVAVGAVVAVAGAAVGVADTAVGVGFGVALAIALGNGVELAAEQPARAAETATKTAVPTIPRRRPVPRIANPPPWRLRQKMTGRPGRRNPPLE
jgi:hypothetical protein